MKAPSKHDYSARVVWTGNLGEGTSRYTSYGREYRIVIDGKPDLAGTSDPAFHGKPDVHNPEDLFLASISACHMLFYLSLCARAGIRVTAYEDQARGTMVIRADGGGRFEDVTLHPVATIEAGGDEALALRLHEQAHELCFIANSCSVPIRHEPLVRVG
ncbi:MAG: OsmC family protein [Gemmatimonadaceae bacterium]